MDFAQFSTSFNYKIDGLLKRAEHDQIKESAVKRISQIFGKFSKYQLEQHVIPFANSLYMYFQLIVRYAKQFTDITFLERQLGVKMVLDSLLYVIDKTQTHSLIIKKLVKIIDPLIEEYGQHGFIQEILIVYIGCLNKLEKNIVEKLAPKHKSVHLLANTARNAQETNLQAAIIQLVLKLSHNTEKTPLLERMFPELKMSLVADAVNDYLKIRTILTELNKNSTKIFSINCASVMLDHYLVSEFEGANSINGVWLDVNLPLKRLSFFCTPDFLTSFTDIYFGQATNWEVLSFRVEDCLATTFRYNEAVENLEIDIKMRTSSFNLLQSLQFDTIRHLVIQVSKHSKQFNKFVKDIMPQVFSNFPAENFAYMCEEITSDDSTTVSTNIFLQSSKESNRTVMRRIDGRNSDLDDTIFESVSVVDLTEYDEHIQAAELSTDESVKKTKMSRRQKMVDKSLSSISFSESVLAGTPKSKKLSRMSTKRKMSNRKKSKISAPKKRKPNALKISTMAVSVPPKRDSPQIKSKANCKKFEEEPEQAPSIENNSNHCPSDDDLDAVVRDAVQETLNLSQSKVQIWLMNTMLDQKLSPVLLEGSPEFKIPEQRPVPVQYEGTPASNHSSNQPLDQRITKWLSEGHYEPSKTTSEFITQKLSGNTESLLEALAKDDDNNTCIQTPVGMDVVPQTVIESIETEVKELHLPIETNVINDNKSDDNKENRPNKSVDSDSSNVPLAQLAADWKTKNQKSLNTSHTSIIANVEIIEYGSISGDSLIPETRQKSEPQIILQRLEVGNLDSFNKTKTEIKENETSQKIKRVLSQSNSESSNIRTAPKKPNKTAASKLPQKSKKKAENNVQNKKNLSIINEQISSAEASNRDLEVEQREGSLSKQLFDHIIDKEVVSTTNLSKPIVDKDTETDSPSTGSDVDMQKRRRKQPFKRRAEFLFDKLKKETTISVNNDSLDKNLSAKPKVADTSVPESKTEKRRLYNPNDLTYLENMITDDYINSKPEEKIPVIEIKERRRSTKKAPAAKRGRKKKVQDLDDVDFTKLKTTITEPKAAEGTEGEKPFQKVFAEFARGLKEHKEKKKMEKLINKSKKRRGKKKDVLSSSSTESSPEPFGIPMETLLRKRRSSDTSEVSVKRAKKNDGRSKNVNVISNIVIKEADTLQPEPLDREFNNLGNTCGNNCCRKFSKSLHVFFLEYITHSKICHDKLLEEENFRKIVDIMKTDFLRI